MNVCLFVITVSATDLDDDDPLRASSGEFGKNVAIVGNRIEISGLGDSDSSDDEDLAGELLVQQQMKGTSKMRKEKKENPRYVVLFFVHLGHLYINLLFCHVFCYRFIN